MTFLQAAVWLKYGECHLETGDLEASEVAYQRVVEMAPNHHEARRTLSNVLHKLGRPEEALDTLTQGAAFVRFSHGICAISIKCQAVFAPKINPNIRFSLIQAISKKL